MPIDARIPLGVQGIDPNGFINALAAGQKQRELNNASDRLARKDELATAETNALATYARSPRGPEDRAAVWAVSPKQGMALDKAAAEIEQNTQDAAYNKVRTDKVTTEAAIKKHGMISQLLGAVKEDPSLYPAVRAKVIEIEPSAAKSWPEGYDAAFVDITYRGGMKVGEQLQAQKANKPPEPKWDSYSGTYVNPPGSAPTTAPAGLGTVVPGGELPPPDDIDAAVLHRAGQGPAPAGNVDYEGLSDPGLDELQRTSTASRKPPPSAVPPAPPVSGQPAPVDGPQTPPPPPPPGGVPRSRAEAEHLREQRRIAENAETQRVAKETLKLRQDEAARKDKAATDKAAVQRGEKLTPADASKAKQKLIRIEDAKRQIALVRATWEGTKDAQGKQVSKGIKGTLGAGPGANLYAPDLFYEAGEKFNAAVESLAASKTALLRVPGIGSQSDLEQALERMDLPSRNTHEGTTEQEIKAYEDVITNLETGLRAALAGPPEEPAEAGPAAPATPPPAAPPTATAQSDRPMPKPVQEFDAMPMPGEYAGKRIRTPDGGVYRSDGRQWVRQ